MNCRHCNSKLEHEFIDLGKAPPSNNYISKDNYHTKEQTFPLRVMVCNHCWLVQTQDFSKANELFTDEYAYFSSTSKSFLAHSKNYVSEITSSLKLNARLCVDKNAAASICALNGLYCPDHS